MSLPTARTAQILGTCGTMCLSSSFFPSSQASLAVDCLPCACGGTSNDRTSSGSTSSGSASNGSTSSGSASNGSTSGNSTFTTSAFSKGISNQSGDGTGDESSHRTPIDDKSGHDTPAGGRFDNDTPGDKSDHFPRRGDTFNDDSSIMETSSSDPLSDDFDRTFMELGGAECDPILPQAEIPFSVFSKALSDGSGDLVPEALQMLNALCRLYEEHNNIPAGQRMEFIDHSHALLLHHPGRSPAPRPQVIAVLASVARSWRRDPSSSIAWHHVAATAYMRPEDDDEQLLKDCKLSLSALTQSRPDLPGYISLAISRSTFRLLWSDPTSLLMSSKIEWSEPSMVIYVLNFIHFLYSPFARDPTVRLDVASSSGNDLHNRRPVWLINDDNGGTYRSTTVLSVGEGPRQNWVVSASEYRAAGASEFAPCPRTIVKDSWPSPQDDPTCEGAILRHLHAGGDVPGVCRLLSTFVIPMDIHGSADVILMRLKHRVVMDGTGQDLYSCKSVLEFLMVMYDVLEVLKHIHETHGVLHRDISPGNILRRSVANTTPVQDSLKFAADIVSTKYQDVRPGPRCTLIDFDNAFWHGHTRQSSLDTTVGTPSYIARSVCGRFEIGYTAPTPPFVSLKGSALECYINACGEQAYNDVSTIDIRPQQLLEHAIPKDRAHPAPHHDAESCFWVIMRFLVTALPASSGPHPRLSSKAQALCDRLEMKEFGIMFDHREPFFYIDEQEWSSILSGDLRQFGSLASSLARSVRPIYEYCDPMPSPYHLHHAMQRILLREICRVLDARSDVALKTHARRTDITPEPPRSSTKRSGDDLECPNNARRRRLS